MAVRADIGQVTVLHVTLLTVVPPLSEKARVVRNRAAERFAVDGELRVPVAVEGGRKQVNAVIAALRQGNALSVALHDIPMLHVGRYFKRNSFGDNLLGQEFGSIRISLAVEVSLPVEGIRRESVIVAGQFDRKRRGCIQPDVAWA